MQKKGIGEFIFTIVLWVLIGGLVQWLMQSQLLSHDQLATSNAVDPSVQQASAGLATYWNAIGIVALFFGVLAFWARDLMRDNPLTRSLRIIGSRLLGTTFDIGLFALGGFLFLMFIHGDTATVPMWQALFIGISFPLFVVILVVLGAIHFLLKYTRLSLISIPSLEFKPLWRVGIYIVLCLLLILTAWLAI
ncbi:hypothetical protein [Phytohalomonas tamaricis]|uniref:hypothetical protein n=1 Tax=Phytohalomonas tamaricis TaxID=2081032 RepID=UPI000D0AE1EC|nr:hypothetical protein [Phytohalomonas tamaricis]